MRCLRPCPSAAVLWDEAGVRECQLLLYARRGAQPLGAAVAGMLTSGHLQRVELGPRIALSTLEKGHSLCGAERAGGLALVNRLRGWRAWVRASSWEYEVGR